MKLNRRTLSLAIASAFASATAVFSTASRAQLVAAPAVQEGVDYQKLKQRNAVGAPANKIEVIEFFWFGCPHCNSLDPQLDAWLKKAPADVAFKRVHINFDPENSSIKRTEVHQRLFYTLETMGLTDAKSIGAVFNAIHADRKTLNTRDGVLEWAKTRGLDVAKFTATYDDGFNMSRKMRGASQLQEAYKVDGVPFFAIDGQYITSPSMAKGPSGFFGAMDGVIEKVRKDRAPATAPAAEKKPAAKK